MAPKRKKRNFRQTKRATIRLSTAFERLVELVLEAAKLSVIDYSRIVSVFDPVAAAAVVCLSV